MKEDLAGAWCNGNLLLTSLMEAVSFVTPVVEKFMIHAVADEMRARDEPALRQRCLDFIREEAVHSRTHGKFNAALLKHLGAEPPGIAAIRAATAGARRHLSVSSRLGLAAAIEHLAAVMSGAYLSYDEEIGVASPFAKALFELHAREEIGHCSVVFDLWRERWPAGRRQRIVAIMAVLLPGVLYLAAAVPWVLYRKTGRTLPTTLGALRTSVGVGRLGKWAGNLATVFFSFVRADYHPDRLDHAPLRA
ncbi:MAG: metal-dependent hydrolase [Rhodocyclales bacterium]|nr:metal-dependent hydrolase [Rhodocyclales bacterium]